MIAPEFAPTALELDEPLGQISMGLQETPYVANTASHIANKVDNVLPFGSFSYLTTSSRYITVDKALKDPHIKRVVGHSQGGSVALELQQHHPDLMCRTYNAPIVDLKELIANSDNSNVERYRTNGDLVSALDTSANTTSDTK